MDIQEMKQNKKLNYSACTFRGSDAEIKNHDFVTFSSYSHILIKVLKDVEEFINTTKYIHHSLYVRFDDDKEHISISFYSDEAFFKFKKKVEDAGLEDYKEWLLSYYKDGAR